MAPPTYGDLGKSARDVFGKGFHFGLVKLDVKVQEDGCYNTTYHGFFLINDNNGCSIRVNPALGSS